MKKITLIVALIAGISFNSNAQHFIASFGIEHSWDIPVHVSHVIYDDYYGYDWVHATRVRRHGRMFFDVVLQRGDVFVELHIGSGGRIYRTRHWDYYPFHDHVCSYTCGYHPAYYRTYYNACHSHRHHGHNHVIYRKNVHVHNHHYNTHVVHKHHSSNRNDRSVRRSGTRVSHSRSSGNRQPERRDRYHSTSGRDRKQVSDRRVVHRDGRQVDNSRRSSHRYSAGSSRNSSEGRSRSNESSRTGRRRSY